MTEFEDILETILEEYARRDSEGEFDTWKETDAFVKEKAEVLLAYAKEESVSEDLEEAANAYIYNENNYSHSRTDTFKAGAKWQKEKIMKNAIDAHCFGFQGAALFSFKLPACNYLVGSEVKVIVIKED
jgi:hypothetical protein